MNRKGQTALEYLLIIVVAMAVVIAVMVWMQASQSQIANQTSQKVDAIMCALQDCSVDGDCQKLPCREDISKCDAGTRKCMF
jgi:hypothetical protein